MRVAYEIEHAFDRAGIMGWDILWALVLGLGLSAVVEAGRLNPFSAAWLSRLMDYVWLVVALVIWTIVQTWLLPRLGVPT